MYPMKACEGNAIIFGIAALVLTLLVLMVVEVFAKDDGRYAESPLRNWFNSLQSGKGPCCSDADGTAVADVDWESKDGHYRVRLEGQWVDVPPEAVLTGPNLDGRTIVWPIPSYNGLGAKSYFGPMIRCFIAGAAG
jgi:hypothetical protein